MVMENLVDAYAERKYQEVQEDTFGHLKPKKNQKYNGWMLWAYSVYGDIVLIDAAFNGLGDSPWLFQAMQDFIGENIPETGVFRWKGVFENYCFVGNIKLLTPHS